MSDEQPDPQKRHAGLAGEASGARPGPGSVFAKVLSSFLSGALIVLLFAAIIPKLTEFDSVGSAIKAMDPLTVLLLLVAALLIRLLLALAYAALMPRLTLWKSLIAREASSAVSNVIPGPSGTASQWAIVRSWKVSNEQFAQAMLAVSASTDVLVFAAPGALFVVWVLLGMPASVGGDHEWAFGLAAIIVAVIAVTVIVAIARSVKLAARLGHVAQICVNPLRRLFGKPCITTWPDKVVVLRADLVEALRVHGKRVVGYVVAGYVLNGLLLVWCLWACGVSREQLPLSLGLLLYSVGRAATIIQITPGGVGVVEIVYTSIYVAVLGESAHDSVVAGVLVYRVLTYLLPIITGAFAYVIWRLMRRAEIHRATAADAVG